MRCSELKTTVCFEYDLEIIIIQHEDRQRGKWKLEAAFDHLDKLILVTTIQTGYIPIQEIRKRVVDFLTNGFEIGDRHYRFIGCPNSQMRSHSVWMYARDGLGHTVDSIRTWMGDVSHEGCVSTYLSRLGQCFTSTRNTVEVKSVEWIEDITRDTAYNFFTDALEEYLHLLHAEHVYIIDWF